MTELPSGTVTFLFTDLEVSTRLWDEEPEAMRRALARHDEILRDAIAEHSGRVVKGTGDGVHAVFVTADDAVSAAVEGQQALHAESWEPSEPLRVRMGIHTGVAELRDGDYFGSEVNRAARVMAVAHGGQIVCTRVSEELVRDRFKLLDLGEHRLRDLRSSVHLFQVEVTGVPSVHAPLRSVDAYRSNLPYESSSFIGRARELRAVVEVLSESRVVSIVGVGGVGKTRLALQVGSELLPRFDDGVWLCELGPVVEETDVHDAIAAAVGYTPPQGVPVSEGLRRFFEQKWLLLILDNCEHLIRAVSSFVADTTSHSARVSVLTTSREALGVRGEQISLLAPLELPGGADAASVLASEAGALFVARAREARGELEIDDTNAESVHDLCRRLDGIPLALELAAAQASVMTPAEIRNRLDRQFRLLTGGRHALLERHQTLRAAIDWSYDLLDDDERALLGRLSVCIGGFDLDAAAAIAQGIDADEFAAFDLLRSLVSKSLVERTERDSTTRYRMLEMIRQYAGEHLDASNAADLTRDDHARYYLALAIELFHDLRTRGDYEALDRLELETPNIAAGLRWLLANDRVDELLVFFGSLPFVDGFVLPPSTLDELATIADEIVTQESPNALGLANACWFCSFQKFLEGDTERYRQLGEIAKRPTEDGFASVVGFIIEAVRALFDGHVELAVTAAAHAVDNARADGDAALLAWTLAYQSLMESYGDTISASALAHAEDALTAGQRTGSTIAQLFPLAALATVEQTDNPTRTLEAADRLARIDTTRRRFHSKISQSIAIWVRCRRGELIEGLLEWQELFRDYHHDGERFMLSTQLSGLANVLAPTHPATAADLAAIAESDAIAPIAAFSVQPYLVELGDDQHDAVAEAHERARSMSYDDAIEFALAAVERVVAKLERDTPARWLE